jgi:hypothetical protein
MGWLDDLFGAPKKCGKPVIVEVRVPGFWGDKKVPKTMACTRGPGHWGGCDPMA